MKTRLPRFAHLVLIFVFATSYGTAGQLEEIEGKTTQEVLELLGAPRSTLSHAGLFVLGFNSCKVTFRDGVAIGVAKPDSPEGESVSEMQVRVASEKASVAEKLLNRYRASGEVSQLSPQDELRFWQSFQQRNLQLNVESELTSARQRVANQAHERALQEHAAQLVALQNRINSLEEERDREKQFRRIYRIRSHRHRHSRRCPRSHFRRGLAGGVVHNNY